MKAQDRNRFIIEEARTGRILTRDLHVQNPKILKKLSGPCVIEFDVDHRHPSVQHPDGTGPILFKPWGHWCHVEREIRGKRVIIASALFQPSEVDQETGLLKAQWQGFSGYPKDLPWLQNWNPIAVDPFEIVHRIWTHLQSYSNGNLGVQVYSPGPGGTRVTPPNSNTELLPGFSFDSQQFIQDFFAIFIRRIDFTDCGDYINKLARDIPFDYFEESEWNEDHTAINKFIRLEYPHGGVFQDNLSFRMNENVIRGKSKIESEIEWTSDIGIRGWFPGKVYSSQISNADPNRYRRFILEEDARINSTERSEAWAHRQLARRQFPSYWETITINMHHPNAPFGTWDVGDQIRVQGLMPWVGYVDQVHKIIAWSLDETSATCELTLRAEGAFNYDPIFFEGKLPNLLANPSFTASMFNWTAAMGSWSRDSLRGKDSLGAARVTCNGQEKLLLSEAVPVAAGDDVTLSAWVYWQNLVATDEPLELILNTYNSDGELLNTVVFDSTSGSGESPGWVQLSNAYTIPSGVASMRAGARVTEDAMTGSVWYDEFYFTKDD
ncbi:minor tail protein [Mycobacterium phage Giuseppe]|uniref:Minor tail protein n=3 Tax=Plotvirus plot TaxID=2170099 RepID=A0A5P8DBZ3_9CAUD|nr:minor tail protein [Mycobacterium phage Delton]QFG14178.1 minor tail protein [Mycobacterium phage Giuseppe]QFP95952.1 minor tail protein [Mycobacterium phage Helpful]WNN93741.1 minor tail protein [Mycobacterium phage Mopey]